MSVVDESQTGAVHAAHTEQDLGPLAWVLDELRKSLEAATKAMARFVRDADAARASDLETLDAAPLRIARQQLHQAAGALEMVGLSAPAQVLRAMENAVHRFVQRPELCTDSAAQTLERTSFALVEYLESVLAGKNVPAVALFPQYRDTQLLAGYDKVHPADLWPAERRLREPVLETAVEPLAYGPQARAMLDGVVLRIVKSDDLQAAAQMRELCLRLAEGLQDDASARSFWKVAAGFFDAFSRRLLVVDVYVKRMASRVLMQYAAMARGVDSPMQRLLQDLLFFCAQAGPAPAQAKALQAVRQAYGMPDALAVDYQSPRFGRYDPAVLTLARKRIAAATESWSALAGGDRAKFKMVAEQFALVAESLIKLQPKSYGLARALIRVSEAVTAQGEPPAAELAMEVATAVLYLQAVFATMDTSEADLAEQSSRLVHRLEQALQGQPPQPLEPWMEDLYRQASDHQTMGSVVGELRATMGEAERQLDLFFRNPEDTSALAPVSAQMSQMRGVLSVLGLDQASLAMLRMRETVERLMLGEVAPQERLQVFERLGNSLGALGFLIDMLSYQRTMARKLFVYDEELGELRILMGHRRSRADDPVDVELALERSPMPEAGATPASPPARPTVAQAQNQSIPAPAAMPGAVADAMAQVLAGMQSMSGPVPPVQDTASQAADMPAAPAQHSPAEGLPAQALTPPTAVPSQDLQAAASPVAAAAPLQMAPASLETDEELLDIFLEEAREVVGNGQQALLALAEEPGDLSEQTTLRRAFHTLKGSSRMVGLDEFGEAAWAMEQMLNAWLAEQKALPEPLRALAGEALQAFGQWAQALENKQAQDWQATPFRAAADAMRLHAVYDGAPLAPRRRRPDAAPDLAMDNWPEVQAAVQADAQPQLQTDLSQDSEDSQSLESLSPPGNAQDSEEIDFSAFEAAMRESDQSALDSISGTLSALPMDLPNLDLPAADAASMEQPAPEPTASEQEAPPLPAMDWGLEIAPSFAAPAPQAEAEQPLLPELEQDAPATAALADTEATGDAPAPADTAAPVDMQVMRLIDGLRISAPLYHVYLNEADEWSSLLDKVLHAWLEQPRQPVPDAAIALAHSLAGSSATVGFKALSELARLLEHTLSHLQPQRHGQPAQIQTCVDASDEVQRLLHQFAAGFVKTPLASVEQALQELLALEIDRSEPDPDGDADAEAEALWQAKAQDNAWSLWAGSATGLHPSDEDALEQDAAAPLPQPGAQPGTAQTAAEPAPAPAQELAQEPAASLPASATAEEAVAEASVPGPDATPALASTPQDTSPKANAWSDADALLDAAARKPVVQAPFSALTDAAAQQQEAQLQQRIDEAIAHAMAQESVLDDDIDALDEVDADLFPIFEEEAVELLPRLGGALRRWHARPGLQDARNEALRVLHTLKGSARLAGAMRLGEMAHRLESALEHVDAQASNAEHIEPLLGSFDSLQASFEVLRMVGEQAPENQPINAQLQPWQMPAPAAVQADAPAPAAVVQAAMVAEQPQPILAPLRPGAQQTVRVRAHLLDRLINQAGEVLIARSRVDARLMQARSSLGDLTGNLERLRLQLRDIEVQAETQMQSRLALSKDTAASFDPLEFDRFTRVQELTRMMAESVNDVATVQRNLQREFAGAEDDLVAQGRQARDLQRDLLRTRMVEFDSLAERLYAVVRQTSKEMGKQVRLNIVGGTIEMDRGMLDRMMPAFEHLLRNCVAHGIEAPELREQAGKPAVGKIEIILTQERNDVALSVEDDGAGLDLARIRDKAVAQGLWQADEPLTAVQAGRLIFEPGFTTAAELTGVSGRGIGMDVVRSEVNALGGRIETSSVPGQGSAFRLVLPLTTAVTQVVMLRIGRWSVGVPASLVEMVRRAPLDVLEQAYVQRQFQEGGEALPFYWAGALWQTSAASDETVGRTRPVLILRSAAQRIALHVDEVLGNQEVVVKNLGPQLARLPGLTGISVLPSGAVVQIYNPVALATVYGERLHAALDAAQSALLPGSEGQAAVPAQALSVTAVPLILVVDDSITVRRVTQRLLQREGYRVSVAADGLQALERLQEERPLLVLSDIEMPRMDGFDLLRNIRADKALRDLPVAMITSRIAQKHRDMARQLGANHYLGKPYSDEELLGLIRHYAMDQGQDGPAPLGWDTHEQPQPPAP